MSTFYIFKTLDIDLNLTDSVDCSDPTCSGHGFCVSGSCVCKKGWKGDSCERLDEDARQCLPDCGGRGRFDLESQTCVCDKGWTGDDCKARVCNIDCGKNGRYALAWLD